MGGVVKQRLCHQSIRRESLLLAHWWECLVLSSILVVTDLERIFPHRSNAIETFRAHSAPMGNRAHIEVKEDILFEP